MAKLLKKYQKKLWRRKILRLHMATGKGLLSCHQK